ncbi:hypothetical protein PAXINDRAFT_84805 [Paxillus involutus ATCC 200175]|uniref:T6SS Phospholipase effector Tle1-like catalytic domain-containing protein n=1 Tax=Paxillus involutus ATCC 200175 TaxID=664439 RepID=A0A0C9TVB6_PAXIN|nr:hypothetical protein PAXINDRAFT_84805 [Paxillus involutus ATCC 200175]
MKVRSVGVWWVWFFSLTIYVRSDAPSLLGILSSVGLAKEDVYLTSSSSVEHACHFRHALALEERRVKFLSEYFHRMNTHCKVSKTSNIKEVWFAGTHLRVLPHYASGIVVRSWRTCSKVRRWSDRLAHLTHILNYKAASL